MKIKIGRTICDVEIRTNEDQLIVGRGVDGEFVNEIGLTDITVSVRAGEFPTAPLECEIFGQEHELDLREDQLVAVLRRHGVQRIEGQRE